MPKPKINNHVEFLKLIAWNFPANLAVSMIRQFKPFKPICARRYGFKGEIIHDFCLWLSTVEGEKYWLEIDDAMGKGLLKRRCL